MQAAIVIIIGILLFELIIFIHELGHFVSAKLSGIKVLEFALGMGPVLFKFTKAETQYSLRLFPIGGFCQMEGEDTESADPRAFGKAKLWKRMIVLVAGAAMNILLSLVLMLIIVAPAKGFRTPVLAEIYDDTPAQQIGLQAGDTIVEINNFSVHTYQDLSIGFAITKGESISLKYKRDGVVYTVEDIPFEGKIGVLCEVIPNSFSTTISQTFKNTYSTYRMILYSLFGIVNGNTKFTDFSGPIGIVAEVSEVVSETLKTSLSDAILSIINLMAFISLNLGIFNLLPFPALDGGRVVLLLIEGIRRKPLNPKYEMIINGAGFAFLILLIIAVAFKDIWFLFAK